MKNMKNMKNINKQQFIFTLALISLIGLSSAYGQNGLEDLFGFENDNVADNPEAPIHMLVYLGLVVGGFLGICQLKNK